MATKTSDKLREVSEPPEQPEHQITAEDKPTSKPPTARRSREHSKVVEALLSRANTMLRTAVLSREPTQLSKPDTSSIRTVVASLEREKTTLETKLETTIETTLEDDEEMQKFLLDMKKQKEKVKEFTDSDFDTDLEDEAPTSTPSGWNGRKLYLKTCRRLGTRPVPFVAQALEKGKEVVVKNRCMNALDMLSLTNSLIANPKITRLVLDGNMIGNEGAECISWLMKEQESFLENVSLAENGIGNAGFQALGEMLKKNRIVSQLNLSGNLGHDENIAEIANALTENTYLTSLNLSHNHIGDIGAKILAPAIAANDGLQSLDVSWNKIRPAGAVAIVSALRENIILKSLNISMNGMSTPGAMFIGDVLKKNETLTYLNASYNRIYDEGCAYIAKAMEKNESLHHLILHNNPITASGAMTVLIGIQTNKNTAMWKLDLHTVPVVKKCVDIANEISYKAGDFELRHAGLVDAEVNMVGTANKLDCRNPMAIVKNYVEEEGLRMIDFFKQMDKDRGGSISREEFVQGLAAVDVPLTGAQVDRLIKMLDRDGDGEIDYGELVDGDREYKRSQIRKRMLEMDLIKEHLAKAKEAAPKKVPSREPFA